MFTGIIKDTGRVLSIEEREDSSRTITVASTLAAHASEGASIAINGACLTVLAFNSEQFTFQAVAETLKLTNLSELQVDAMVNLEPAVKAQDALDGHIVSGHVDGVAEVVGFSENELTVSLPECDLKFIAKKGSITLNGVSLTIAQVEGDFCSVALIEHTLENTNLSNLKSGDRVNYEVDVIARYAVNALEFYK